MPVQQNGGRTLDFRAPSQLLRSGCSAVHPDDDPGMRLGRLLFPTPAATVATGWQDEAVFVDGDDWYAAALAAIASAERTVTVETYALDGDAVGTRLLAALAAAAGRGCAVHLLVDGVGSAPWLRVADGGPAAAGPEIRVWNPLPWTIVRRAGLNRAWRFLTRINRRDHRKLCLIDGRVAWLGSINWVADHSRRERGDAAWHDVGARVEGPGVAALEAAVAQAWRRAWPLRAGQVRPRWFAGPAAPQTLCASVRLNHTFRLRRAAYHDLLTRLRSARERIWIANAYVVPRGSLLRALGAAARRGVDVRVLVPAVSDHAFMPWITAVFADALAAAGVRVWAYRPRMLHAKTMLIDDLALVGSHNLNSRSFFHDLEVEAVLVQPSSVARLVEIYRDDLSLSDQLLPPALARLRWWQRLGARAALLAKSWL